MNDREDAQERTGARPRSRRDLTGGPVGSTLLLFALPTLGSTVLQSLNGSINAIWVGRFLGEDALTATANGNILMFLMLAFVFGFGMASTILIGQAVGRGDIVLARRTLGTAVGSFFVAMVLVSALGWIFAPQLLRLLSAPPDAFALSLAYTRVVFIALPAAMMMALLMMAMRGAGDAMTPLWFMMLAVVLDCGLNPVFILGLGPAPRLGIAGSGVATAIANTVSLIAMIVYVYARDLPLRLDRAELAYLKPDFALLKPIFRMGVAMGLQMIVISSSALAMLGLVNRHGVLVTAAYSVTQQLWTYVQMPAMALGAAASAMVAQNIGAGNWTRVSRITRSAVLFNLLLTGSIVALIGFADHAALGLFLGADSPALPVGQHINRLATWGFVFFGVTLVLFGTIRANGAVVWPLIILFIAMYPIRLGFAITAERWLGTDALWLSFPVGSIAATTMAIAVYFHGGWKRRGLGRPQMGAEELIERELADSEPGGSFQPRG